MDEIQEHMAQAVGSAGGLIVTVEDLDRIKSNRETVCLECGVPITKENDSGWEGFVDAWTTQPLCKVCDKARSTGLEKGEE